MTWFTGLITFLLIWWTMLFAVLPWGVRHNYEHDPSEQSPGAPQNPDLKKKFIATTVLSLILWAIIYGLIQMELISFRDISLQMMTEDEVM